MTRQIDRCLKRVDLSAATNVNELKESFEKNVESVDVVTLASGVEDQIESAIRGDDLSALLAYYENKGLLAQAARDLKDSKRKAFEEWLEGILRKDSAPQLTKAIRDALPKLP